MFVVDSRTTLNNDIDDSVMWCCWIGLLWSDWQSDGFESCAWEDVDGQIFKSVGVLSRHAARLQQLAHIQHQQTIARQFIYCHMSVWCRVHSFHYFVQRMLEKNLTNKSCALNWFLPRDASAERGYEIAYCLCPSVCLSVCLSVMFRYRVQIGLNSWKIISQPYSLRPLLWLTSNMGHLVPREHPQN